MNIIVKSAVTAAIAFAVSAVSVATLAADKSSKANEWPSFKKVDADNNGSISMDEARSIPGLADTFTQYDKNNDGQLSKSEYEAAKKAAHRSASKSSMGGSAGSSGSSPSRSANKPAKDEVGGASTGAGSSTGSTTTK